MRAFKESLKFLCDDTRQSKGFSTVSSFPSISFSFLLSLYRSEPLQFPSRGVCLIWLTFTIQTTHATFCPRPHHLSSGSALTLSSLNHLAGTYLAVCDTERRLPPPLLPHLLLLSILLLVHKQPSTSWTVLPFSIINYAAEIKDLLRFLISGMII